MVKNAGWITTSVPTELAEQIEDFVNSKEGKKLGYTSKTGFIADALREQLEQLSGKSKKHQTKLEDKIDDMRNEMTNMRGVMVTILDLFGQSMNKGKIDLQDPIIIKALSQVNSGISKEREMMKNKEIQKIIKSS